MSTTQPVRPGTPRPRWQFSLFTLLIAMTWVGLACVALCNPSELWTGLVFVLAVGSLLVAGLCIVYRDGRARAFAVGFVIFAATYLFVSMGDTPDVPDAHTQLPTTRWGIALYSLLHGDKLQTTAAAWPVYSAPTYTATLPPILPATPAPPAPRGMTVERVVMATATSSGPSAGQTSAGPSDPIIAAAGATAPAPATAFVPITTYISRTTTQPLIPLSSFLEVTHQVLAIFLGVLGGIVAQILYSTRRQQSSVASGEA